MFLGPTEYVIICLILLCLLALVIGAGLVAWYLIKNAKDAAGSNQAGRVPCPYCAELILPDAKVCRFCGNDLAKELSS